MVLKSTQEAQEQERLGHEIATLVGDASNHFQALWNFDQALKLCQERGFVGLHHEITMWKRFALANLRQVEDDIRERQDKLGIELVEMPPPF